MQNRLLLALVATCFPLIPASASETPIGARSFPPDAVVDVTRAPYHAVPDDRLDDTAALQRAVSDHVDSGRFLFFPAGTYDLSRTLTATNAAGLWRAHLTLQGAGRDRTVLRLADGAVGFADPQAPQAVVATGSHWQPGDGLDGGGNKAFRNHLLDLTIDTGRGNPGAIGILYAASNVGAVENVTVRSSDGLAATGIAITRRIPGPALLKHVAVEGFGIGIEVADIQYGLTIEHLVLRGQREVGLRTDRNLLHIRRLSSDNRVPAIRVTSPEGMLTLLESELSGGSSDRPALECEGSLLLRGVRTQGYAVEAVRCAGRGLPGPDYAQVTASVGEEPRRTADTALLPVEETPVFWNDDLSDWEAVGARRSGEPDDTAAIQRAFDAGKGTVYFPPHRVYFLSGTVVVRGAVQQVLGMGSELSLGAAKEAFSDRVHPRALIRIDRTDAPIVFFEHLFFNAQYPGEVVFENNTPATVVIRHCAGWIGAEGFRRSYRNTELGRGTLFLEDVFLPGWQFDRQTVWARQFNPENWDGDGSEAQVANRGGRLWVLGFKTEGPAPYLHTSDGGVTELLGAYNYVSATKVDPVPADAVPYPVDASDAALTFTSENFRSSDYRNYITVRQGGVQRSIPPSELPPRNGRRGDRSLSVPLWRVPGEPGVGR